MPSTVTHRTITINGRTYCRPQEPEPAKTNWMVIGLGLTLVVAMILIQGSAPRLQFPLFGVGTFLSVWLTAKFLPHELARRSKRAVRQPHIPEHATFGSCTVLRYGLDKTAFYGETLLTSEGWMWLEWGHFCFESSAMEFRLGIDSLDHPIQMAPNMTIPLAPQFAVPRLALVLNCAETRTVPMWADLDQWVPIGGAAIFPPLERPPSFWKYSTHKFKGMVRIWVHILIVFLLSCFALFLGVDVGGWAAVMWLIGCAAAYVFYARSTPRAIAKERQVMLSIPDLGREYVPQGQTMVLQNKTPRSH